MWGGTGKGISSGPYSLSRHENLLLLGLTSTLNLVSHRRKPSRAGKNPKGQVRVKRNRGAERTRAPPKRNQRLFMKEMRVSLSHGTAPAGAGDWERRDRWKKELLRTSPWGGGAHNQPGGHSSIRKRGGEQVKRTGSGSPRRGGRGAPANQIKH